MGKGQRGTYKYIVREEKNETTSSAKFLNTWKGTTHSGQSTASCAKIINQEKMKNISKGN